MSAKTQVPGRIARPQPAAPRDVNNAVAFAHKLLEKFGQEVVQCGINGLNGRNQAVQQLMLWNYKRGQDIARYSEGKRAQNGVVPALAQVWGLSDAAVREYRTVADRITPEEFRSLLTIRLQNGIPLTWAHVRQLAFVEDPKERKKYINWVVTKNWTANQLELEISSRGNAASNPRGSGRKAAIPDTFNAMLRTIETRANGIANYQRDVVDDHIDELIDALSPERVTPEIMERIDFVCEQLALLQQTAQTLESTLSRAKERLGTRQGGGQAALEGPADPAVIDVEVISKTTIPARKAPGKKPGKPRSFPRHGS